MIFKILAREHDSITLDAACGDATIMPVLRLKPTHRPSLVPPFTHVGFHLRPNASCTGVTVKPRRFQAGVQTRLTAVVRLAGRPVVDARVVVTGGGVHKAATTGASGIVRLTVLPKWRGFLQVGIPNLTVCSRGIAIDPAHAGKQLTG